jgi:cytochrome c oxidase assembly factor CtaG
VSVPPLVVCFVAASLYALGGRGRRRVWREVAFYSGVLSVFLVLEPPFDGWADTSFALHMTQHVVLLTVSAPLLVLGRPWPRLWLPFPLRARRAVGRTLAGSAGFRLFGRTASRPAVAFVAMTAALAVWHVPALYDAAVRNEGVHILEHVCFLGTALLYWGVLLGAPPVRARIDHLHRAGWFFAALIPSWILAIVLAYATTPLYSAYASLPHRPGGLTAMADQQLAAGVMWVPGSIAYLVAGIVAFYRWLGPAPEPAEPQPEELAWTSSPRTGSPATS